MIKTRKLTELLVGLATSQTLWYWSSWLAFRTLFLFSNGELLNYFESKTRIQDFCNNFHIQPHRNEAKPLSIHSFICSFTILFVYSMWKGIFISSSIAFCNHFMQRVQVFCRLRNHSLEIIPFENMCGKQKWTNYGMTSRQPFCFQVGLGRSMLFKTQVCLVCF